MSRPKSIKIEALDKTSIRVVLVNYDQGLGPLGTPRGWIGRTQLFTVDYCGKAYLVGWKFGNKITAEGLAQKGYDVVSKGDLESFTRRMTFEELDGLGRGVMEGYERLWKHRDEVVENIRKKKEDARKNLEGNQGGKDMSEGSREEGGGINVQTSPRPNSIFSKRPSHASPSNTTNASPPKPKLRIPYTYRKAKLTSAPTAAAATDAQNQAQAQVDTHNPPSPTASIDSCSSYPSTGSDSPRSLAVESLMEGNDEGEDDGYAVKGESSGSVGTTAEGNKLDKGKNRENRLGAGVDDVDWQMDFPGIGEGGNVTVYEDDLGTYKVVQPAAKVMEEHRRRRELEKMANRHQLQEEPFDYMANFNPYMAMIGATNHTEGIAPATIPDFNSFNPNPYNPNSLAPNSFNPDSINPNPLIANQAGPSSAIHHTANPTAIWPQLPNQLTPPEQRVEDSRSDRSLSPLDQESLDHLQHQYLSMTGTETEDRAVMEDDDDRHEPNAADGGSGNVGITGGREPAEGYLQIDGEENHSPSNGSGMSHTVQGDDDSPGFDIAADDEDSAGNENDDGLMDAENNPPPPAPFPVPAPAAVEGVAPAPVPPVAPAAAGWEASQESDEKPSPISPSPRQRISGGPYPPLGGLARPLPQKLEFPPSSSGSGTTIQIVGMSSQSMAEIQHDQSVWLAINGIETGTPQHGSRPSIPRPFGSSGTNPFAGGWAVEAATASGVQHGVAVREESKQEERAFLPKTGSSAPEPSRKSSTVTGHSPSKAKSSIYGDLIKRYLRCMTVLRTRGFEVEVVKGILDLDNEKSFVHVRPRLAITIATGCEWRGTSIDDVVTDLWSSTNANGRLALQYPLLAAYSAILLDMDIHKAHPLDRLPLAYLDMRAILESAEGGVVRDWIEQFQSEVHRYLANMSASEINETVPTPTSGVVPQESTQVDHPASPLIPQGSPSAQETVNRKRKAEQDDTQSGQDGRESKKLKIDAVDNISAAQTEDSSSAIERGVGRLPRNSDAFKLKEYTLLANAFRSDPIMQTVERLAGWNRLEEGTLLADVNKLSLCRKYTYRGAIRGQ